MPIYPIRFTGRPLQEDPIFSCLELCQNLIAIMLYIVHMFMISVSDIIFVTETGLKPLERIMLGKSIVCP